MALRTVRNATVAVLVAGYLLSTSVLAYGSTEAPTAVGTHCPQLPAQPNLPPGDPGPNLLWPQSRLGLNPGGVWSLTRGKGVTVAVIDTGVDKSSPVFAPGAVQAGPSMLLAGDTSDYDCDGHGTAVAAIIAGRENGVFGFSGVAPEATILPIRQSYLSTQSGSPIQLADAIRTATAAGARVINISITTTDDPPELRSAVEDALAHDVVVVAAAGNGTTALGAHSDVRNYPAAIPGVLAVGAVDRGGDASSFSQQGTGVLVSAPGGQMAVPAAGFPGAMTVKQGTSFAAPFVAGSAALVLSYRPNLHNWQVVRRLEATADRPAANAPDNTVGWGVINPYRAVTAVLPDEVLSEAPPGPAEHVVPPRAAAPDRGRTDGRVALGVAAAGLLALAVPVAAAAVRRGRARGWRAGA